MKTALITTTINVPKVLALYRKLGPDVQFFVAADEKTSLAAYEFCADIPNCEIYSPERQKELGYECSSLIGWNCVQRRNIALLEAVKWGADVIVTIDDDNIPLGEYFCQIQNTFQKQEWVPNGIKVGSVKGQSPVWIDRDFSGFKASADWFDPGHLLVPRTKHRGFPHAHAQDDWRVDSVCDIRIGVAAGLCLGDPDVDACTRLEHRPCIHSVAELGRAGIIIDPKETKAVFNSQNTAFVRELAPAMFMMPGIGRYDDIYASLICQRVMREHDLHVHFGQPFVWQQRNRHNLYDDLRAEIDGMENVEGFAKFLDACILPSGTVLENTRHLYLAIGESGFTSFNSVVAAFSFLDDIEKVL